MSSVARDLRFALRQLRKAPGFTLTAVLTLALGIGASSAIFCLIDGLWLHPMPVPHSDRLTRIFATAPDSQDGLFSYTEYQSIAGRASAFQWGIRWRGRPGRSWQPHAESRWHFHASAQQCRFQ